MTLRESHGKRKAASPAGAGDPGGRPRRLPPAVQPRARWFRLLAVTLLVLFLGAAVTTTVVSLGRYCLTTDGPDTRALPGGLRPRVGGASPSGIASPSHLASPRRAGAASGSPTRR